MSGGTDRRIGPHGPTPGFPGFGEMMGVLMDSIIRNNFDVEAVQKDMRAAIRSARLAQEQMDRIFGSKGDAP